MPSSQARLSGGCQSGARPRGALRAATGAAAWSRGVRGEAGRPCARPRPPSPPGAAPRRKATAPAGTIASPVPNPYTRPGLELAEAGGPGRASRAWGRGHGGASVLLGRFLLCPDDTPTPEERQARKVTAVHQWLLESEKSLPVSFLALGGAA